MGKLAIKGHATRGKELIEILEMLGGINAKKNYGDNVKAVYFINTVQKNGIWCDNMYNLDDYTIFTLEEFLEKFPYKVGDKVIAPSHNIHTIESIHWSGDKIYYNTVGEGFNTSYTAKDLQPYKEQEETMEGKLDEDGFIDNNYHAFQRCVELADENPKEVLVSIDKVCAYLESLTYQDYPGGPMERIVDDYIIKDLRKAMEG